MREEAGKSQTLIPFPPLKTDRAHREERDFSLKHVFCYNCWPLKKKITQLFSFKN